MEADSRRREGEYDTRPRMAEECRRSQVLLPQSQVLLPQSHEQLERQAHVQRPARLCRLDSLRPIRWPQHDGAPACAPTRFSAPRSSCRPAPNWADMASQCPRRYQPNRQGTIARHCLAAPRQGQFSPRESHRAASAVSSKDALQCICRASEASGRGVRNDVVCGKLANISTTG